MKPLVRKRTEIGHELGREAIESSYSDWISGVSATMMFVSIWLLFLLVPTSLYILASLFATPCTVSPCTREDGH